MLGYFFWDPPRSLLTIPFLGISIGWYGVLFALGFYGAAVTVRALIRSKLRTYQPAESPQLDDTGPFVDSLSTHIFFGMVLGARLGHVLFYDLEFYLQHPIEICKPWLGGLASHGGVLGILAALWLFSKKKWNNPHLPMGLNLVDAISIASALTAACIRGGNFFNQEITGLPTQLPWAVLFGNPLDAEPFVPRHPTQLYEACVSLALFICLFSYGRRGRFASNGLITGVYLLLTFSSRMFIEMYKVPQCSFDEGPIRMGQLLSIPLVILGLFLVYRAYATKSMERTELPQTRA